MKSNSDIYKVPPTPENMGGTFTILSETEISYVQMEVDMDDELKTKLISYAKRELFDDEDSLVGWAVADILKKEANKEL